MFFRKNINVFYNFHPYVYYATKDKKALFKEAGKEISKAMGITCPTVYLLKTEHDVLRVMSKDTRGIYDYRNYAICINSLEYKNPYLLLETLLHEMAHIFLNFIVDKQIYQENIETLTFEKYQKLTNLDEEQYNNFMHFFSEFKITKKYQNLVQLDKIYNQNNPSQPYYYNTDSGEIFAEYVATILMNEIIKSVKTDSKALSEMFDELNYMENEMENLKGVYLEENVTDKTPSKCSIKILMSVKNKYNFFKKDSFDIKQYNCLWKQYKKEFHNLQKTVFSINHNTIYSQQ